MNIHHLAVKIAKRESGKKQVDIAQIKEILKILCDMEAEAMFNTLSGVRSDINKSVCNVIDKRAERIFLKRSKDK